jgi:HEAT repeat protein
MNSTSLIFGCLTLLPVPALAAPSVQDLIAQLDGRGCAYTVEGYPERCVERPFAYSRVAHWLLPYSAYECPAAAARCLALLKGQARSAVPALVRALRDGPSDFDTGDGSIPARTCFARALGEIGDPSAIEPLIEALRSQRPVAAPFGAGQGQRFASQQPVLDALASFGEQARVAAPAIIELLRGVIETNNEPNYPPLDLAAAIKALAAIGATEAIPVLEQVLDRGFAAADALMALDRLGATSPELSSRVVTIAADQGADRRLRHAAIRYLKSRATDGGAIVLIALLEDPEYGGEAADALAGYGAAARSAFPVVSALVKVPAEAIVMPDGRRVYSGGTFHRRTALVRVLETINSDEAIDTLVALLADGELSSTVAAALARMDPDGRRSFDKVKAMLSSSGEAQHRGVARYIRRVRRQLPIASLVELLDTSDPKLQRIVLKGLKDRPSEARGALPKLEQLRSRAGRSNAKEIDETISAIRASMLR